MTRTDVGCQLVGEYVDEAEIPDAIAHLRNRASPSAEVERPRIVASYVDRWSPNDGDKEFTVLLRDNRIVAVRGHSLKLLQNVANPTDCGSYAIVVRAGETEVVVALFRVSEVTGVFHGDFRRSRDNS